MLHKPELVFLGTYPPRECGIATFTQDLVNSCRQLLGDRLECKVAALNYSDVETKNYPSEVFFQLDQNSKDDFKSLALKVNKGDTQAVIIQHEYGIYGGSGGNNLLSFVNNCKKPMVITLHTVLEEMSPIVKRVTKSLISKSTVSVVLTQTSKDILIKQFPMYAKKIVVIPHGIHPVLFRTPEIFKKRLNLSDKLLLTTFGFLSPGKGIEYVINSLPQIVQEFPNLLYLVIGETHPVLRRHEGEKYRLSLEKLVRQNSLENNVKFIDRYLSVNELLDYLRATDIYIATSTNPSQAVSGTFSYALGAGRAVISTNFMQAKEYLGDAGILVPIKSPEAYTKAILTLCRDSKLRAKMHLKSYHKTRSMLWSNVAHDYLSLVETITNKHPKNLYLVPELNTKHLRRMTDSFGLFQFAQGDEPNPAFGYATDDNARALIFTLEYLAGHGKNPVIARLVSKYAKFVLERQDEDGSFINLVSADHKPIVENHEQRWGDVFGRSLLALSFLATSQCVSKDLNQKALAAWRKAFPNLDKVSHLRAHAFCLKALCRMYQAAPSLENLQKIRRHADILVGSYFAHRSGAWQWYENSLYYANGILPDSLFTAYQVTHDYIYKKVALSTLEFLIRKTFSGGVYVAIGQHNWHKKGGVRRSLFDQQPEDPYATLGALVSGFLVTKRSKYARLAEKCFSWFLGNNITGVSLYDFTDGGVYDGITQLGVNKNKGAESLISYLLARNLIEEFGKLEFYKYKGKFSYLINNPV